MTPAHDFDREAQRLTEFQIQGAQAERYERWAVPFVLGPWGQAYWTWQSYERVSASWTSLAGPAWSRDSRRGG